MKSARIKKAESLGVDFTFEALPEDHSFRREYDRELEEWIASELDSGNDYAWFCAKVTACLEIEGVTFEGSDYLGSCSYKSERDFKSDAYYSDMLDQALDALLADMERVIGRGMMAKAGLNHLKEVRS